MKTVFDNAMVAHVWAQNSQHSGRSHNGQFYFDGPRLFSYGRHFIVGFVMPDGTALLNPDRYSPSTGKHQSYALRAVRGRYFYVPKLSDLQYYLKSGVDVTPGDYAKDARAKTGILQYVEKNALELSEDAALYILGLINRAKSWPKIRAIAEKAKARADEKQRRLNLAGMIGQAKQWAGLSDAQFDDSVMAQALRHWNGRSGGLREMAKRLHRINSVAKAHCSKRVHDKVKARLAQVRALIKEAEKTENHGHDLRQWIETKKDFRALLPRLLDGSITREGAKSLIQTLNKIGAPRSRHGLLTPAGRCALFAMKAECEAIEERWQDQERRELFALQEQERAEWLSGEYAGRRYLSDEKGGALLRAVGVERNDAGEIVAGELETSQGATVPLVHAIKAFRFVRHVMSTGVDWHANGHTIRVGHFRVDSITAEGRMKAGCHVLHVAEMDRVAGLLGLQSVTPATEALEPSRGAA